jgi:hypothetical protein
MWYYIVKDQPNELYHHGIKGMKWGVRRYQNKDGSLTNAGKRRYTSGDTRWVRKQVTSSISKSISNKIGKNVSSTENSITKKVDSTENISDKKTKFSISDYARTQSTGHRLRLEKKYQEKGLTAYEAKIAADKRIKVEKVVAATAGLTVAACVAYYARNKYLNTYCDTILEKGTVFNNLDRTANPRPGEHLYVNYRKNDTDFFRGQFALGKMSRDRGTVFNHQITAEKDIKIPSLNTRRSVFKQLYDSDPSFRETMQKHSSSSITANAKQVYKNMWEKFGDKDDPAFNVAKRKYFEALRQKGYEAIPDSWDTKASVYRADAPLILLNTSSDSLGKMKISELSSLDVLKAQANSRNYSFVRNMKSNAVRSLHNNHFKESAKTLDRYAKKAERNNRYVDIAYDSYKENHRKISTKALTRQFGAEYEKHFSNDKIKDDAIKRANKEMTRLAFDKKGSVLRDTGKLIDKYGMDYDKAYNIAKRIGTVEEASKLSAIVGFSLLAPGTIGNTSVVAKISDVTARNNFVNRYLTEHPNTDKTIDELNKMYYKKK